MKDQIKKVIEAEYTDIMPASFVMQTKSMILASISKPKPWYQRAEKEDFLLVLSIFFAAGLFYLFGYHPEFKISISIQPQILRNLTMSLGASLVLVLVFVQDYFDRKKILSL